MIYLPSDQYVLLYVTILPFVFCCTFYKILLRAENDNIVYFLPRFRYNNMAKAWKTNRFSGRYFFSIYPMYPIYV